MQVLLIAYFQYILVSYDPNKYNGIKQKCMEDTFN